MDSIRKDCAEVFRRLDDYLDRELAAEEVEAVHHHLRACAGCAGEFRFEATWRAGLRAKLERLNAPLALRARLALPDGLTSP